MIYIISQFIGFAAFFVSIFAYHKNKKEKILGNMVISNILNLIHYLLLGAYTGCITKGLAIFIARGKDRGILRGLASHSNAVRLFTLFCLF